MVATKDLTVMWVDVDGCVHFGFGRRPRLVSGRQRVAQAYIIALFTEIGSIDGYPEFGGSLMESIPKNKVDEATVRATFIAAMSRARKSVINEQSKHPTEPEDRLQTANLLGLELGYSGGQWALMAEIEVRTEAGESIIIRM